MTLALQSLLLLVNLTSLKNPHQMGTRHQLCVLTLAHLLYIVEHASDDDEMVVSDKDDVPGPHKESGELGKSEQPTALVEAEVCDLFHIGCKNTGVNHFSAVEHQRQVIAHLMTFLTRYRYYLANTKFLFLYPQMLIFSAWTSTFCS